MTILVLADDDYVDMTTANTAADLLISCGDLADSTISRAAQAVRSPAILAVKGNHDSSEPFSPPIMDAHLKIHLINRTSFGGFQGSWRYKPRGHYLYEQDEADRLLKTFPRVDVFIAHNSPRHVHDREDSVHFGFDAFRSYIERARPRLFIHGHQHLNCETLVGDTKVLGVYGLKYLTI
jgi:Icc-related predicted phosphoesterase